MKEETKKNLKDACRGALLGLGLGASIVAIFLSCLAVRSCQAEATNVNATTPALQAKRLSDTTRQVEFVTEERYQSLEGYTQTHLLDRVDGDTTLPLSGGTTTNDTFARCLVPVKAYLYETNSSGDLGVEGVEFAEYRFSSQSALVRNTTYTNLSALGSFVAFRPIGGVLVVNCYGNMPSMASFNGEIRGTPVVTYRQSQTDFGATYIGNYSFTLTDPQHWSYVYMNAETEYFAQILPSVISEFHALSEENGRGQQTGYRNGYRIGKEEGITLGQQMGESEDTSNVFALFTEAFTAVGGFFNLKVFGFLPLYWFFLAPLFIAIITLLLRMVKH